MRANHVQKRWFYQLGVIATTQLVTDDLEVVSENEESLSKSFGEHVHCAHFIPQVWFDVKANHWTPGISYCENVGSILSIDRAVAMMLTLSTY